MEIRKNKKGGLTDLIYIMGVLLVFGFMLLIGGKFLDSFNSNLIANNLSSSGGQAAVTQINNMYPTVIDNSFLLLMVGLLIVALVLAMLVAVHPVFFIFYILFLVFVIFIGGVFSNIYVQAATQVDMVAIADKMVYMSHIMKYLPMIVGVFGFILAIVLYRTFQQNQ